MHEARPRSSATNLPLGSWTTIDEDGRAPRVAAGDAADRRSLCGSQCDVVGDFTGLCESPKSYQQFARHRDNRDPTGSALQFANTLTEPNREPAFWLIA